MVMAAADHGAPGPDHYQLLGVPRQASREQIAQAWRRRFAPLLNLWHDVAAGRRWPRLPLPRHAPGRPVRIVANLPYNVATPLLIKWLTADLPIASMTLMFQKEVAARILNELMA